MLLSFSKLLARNHFLGDIGELVSFVSVKTFVQRLLPILICWRLQINTEISEVVIYANVNSYILRKICKKDQDDKNYEDVINV